MANHFKHLIKKTHDQIQQFTGRVAKLKFQKEQVEAQPRGQNPAHSSSRDKFEMNVSGGTMAKFVVIALLLILLGRFLYDIRDILILFFVSLLFAAALDPMVDALERKKIPRAVGVILIYLLAFFILGLFISNLVPIVAKEISELAARVQDFIANIVSGDISLPSYLESFRPALKDFFAGVDISNLGSYKDVLLKFGERLSSVAGNVMSAVIVVFDGFFNTILVLVITFLMTVDERGIDKFMLSLFPARHAEYIRRKTAAIKEKMGYWLRGQVVLCVIVGLLVYVGFFIIGLFTKKVEYAATMALLAGFTELIPYAGPFLAWLIAMPIVANQSVPLIFWMTVLMYIVQLLENNFIVPLVMKRAVGISPIFIMFAMLVGFQFLGVLGIVLSVPVATTVAVFVKDYAEKEK